MAETAMGVRMDDPRMLARQLDARTSGASRPLRYHFSGIAGAGMNPLARLMRARGHHVQGSDRAIDHGQMTETAALLRGDGIVLVPHDGSAITTALDRFVYSTAVESQTPERAAALRLRIPMVPRPQMLAELVNAGSPGVAISGTCGKSTVTGMIAWLLEESGSSASVIGGAPRVGEGIAGGLLIGPEHGPVVAEACESDGTLTGYRPALGVIHNVSRDHAELHSLRTQFRAFARQCGRLLVNAGCPEAAALGHELGARTYGVSGGPDALLHVTSTGPDEARGTLAAAGCHLTLEIRQPGLHNLENAAAAALVALELGLSPTAIEEALPRFPGLARRLELIGVTRHLIRVVDDYAHNPEKLRAALTTAQAGCDRLVAVFQPHGFGPARFMRGELARMLPRVLRERDRFCYAEVFYGGGTTVKDVSSAMLAADLPARLACATAPDHDAVVTWVAGEARPRDTVLLMGARDPRLSALARRVFHALDARTSSHRGAVQLG
jgi:UDP-N-acetylmuramate--alanine ligase